MIFFQKILRVEGKNRYFLITFHSYESKNHEISELSADFPSGEGKNVCVYICVEGNIKYISIQIYHVWVNRFNFGLGPFTEQEGAYMPLERCSLPCRFPGTDSL